MRLSRFGVVLSIMCLVMLFAPSASAQITATVPGAITVVGEGTATAPAETASVVIVIGGDSNVYIDPMTIGPDSVPTPSVVDASPVIDALVASGIPAGDIQTVDGMFQGEWGSGMPATPVTILVTVSQPTVEGLTAMLDLVRATASENTLFVNQFSAMYSIADCRPLRQQARANAVANAREQAEDQAVALETTVGDVVASRDTLPMTMGFAQMNGCTTAPLAMPYAMKYAAAPFDPGQPAEVTIAVAVEVSFQLP